MPFAPYYLQSKALGPGPTDDYFTLTVRYTITRWWSTLLEIKIKGSSYPWLSRVP